MLLDPATMDLAPVADQLLARLQGDPRFKAELPAAQIETISTPVQSAAQAVAQLAQARHDLVAAAEGLALPAVAGVHPTTSPRGELRRGPRYDAIRTAYGAVAERQLVASLQIHVAVGGAQRSLAVYNALRAYLPEIAALAANAPYYDGADSGLASVRPAVCVLLPRQGVPPRLASWEQYAAELAWATGSGAMTDPSQWWWEMRLHPRLGTLELRVPDAQTTLDEAAGLIAFLHALVATVAARADDNALAPDVPGWRIAENRFAAFAHGVEGSLADLWSQQRRPTRERLLALVDDVAPMAARLGSAQLLEHARASIARNGAIRQRDACRERGLPGLPFWLAQRFLHPLSATPPAAPAASSRQSPTPS